MRNTIIVLSALAIMALGLYGSAVILFDQERLKAIIAKQVEQQTGRRVEIHGEVRLRLFPGLRISAERVVMGGPDGFDGPDLLSADHLQAQVRLLPLIRGRLDPTEVRVDGVRLNLHTDPTGTSSLDGLLQLAGSDQQYRSGGGAEIALENIVVSLGSGEQELREAFELERMEVEGYVIGQPLQFRFRGSVGEPALFDYLEVDGLLLSTEADRLRLSNMRLAGMVDQGRYDLEMLGNVNVSFDDYLSFSVDGGRLNFNQHEFDLNLRYTGGQRPSFSARLDSKLIDVDVLQVLERMAMVPGLPDDSGVKTALRGMDFDVRLGIEQVARLGLVVEGLEMLATGRDGVVRVQSLQGLAPGATVTGSGELDLRVMAADWQMDLNLDVLGLRSMLEAMRLDWDLDGVGEIVLDMHSRQLPGQDLAGWAGQAHVELVDGYWPLIENLVGDLAEFHANAQFEFLSMAVSIGDDRLDITELHLISPDLTIEGYLSMSLPGSELSGHLELINEIGMVRTELGGTLEQPVTAHGPLVLRPAL